MSQSSECVSSLLLHPDAPIGLAADALGRQLRRAEHELQRRAFGLSARVVLRTGFDEEGGGEWQESLCFGKRDGRCGLYLESGLVERPDSLQTSDLFSANIDTRLAAAKKIPVLVRALEVVELQRREDLGAAVRELAKFVDRLSRADD